MNSTVVLTFCDMRPQPWILGSRSTFPWLSYAEWLGKVFPYNLLTIINYRGNTSWYGSLIRPIIFTPTLVIILILIMNDMYIHFLYSIMFKFVLYRITLQVFDKEWYKIKVNLYYSIHIQYSFHYYNKSPYSMFFFNNN